MASREMAGFDLFQHRGFQPAAIDGITAAGMKITAFGRVAQLGLAELRNAAKRLGRFDLPDPKGTHYSLTLVPAGAEYGVRLRRPEGRTTRGPAWFAAMDRNGDGFVSRAEWLGTAGAFDELDRDGDGLISPEEAEARK